MTKKTITIYRGPLDEEMSADWVASEEVEGNGTAGTGHVNAVIHVVDAARQQGFEVVFDNSVEGGRRAVSDHARRILEN